MEREIITIVKLDAMRSIVFFMLFNPSIIHRKIIGAAKIKISVLENTENAVTLIKQLPNVKIIAVSNNVITVEIAGGSSEIADLNESLVKAGIKVVSFFEEKADLEDLFMKISAEQ